jgi:hypothetical protein
LLLVTATGTRTLARTEGLMEPWLTASSEGGCVLLAFGDASSVTLAELRADDVEVWPALLLAPANAVQREERGRDGVRVSCGEDGARALVRDTDRKLHSVSCRRGVPHCLVSPLAEGVESFAFAANLVAYAGDADAPLIRARHLSGDGAPVGEEIVPGACWAPHGGMCGPPVLQQLGARLVLGARDDTDLIALESSDGGMHWQTLYDAPPQPLRRY